MSKARLQTSIVHTPPPTTNPQDIGSFTYGDAFLKYHIYHNATMDAYTTVVPPQYRGQKIAEKLCDAAYKYAMEQGYNVLPTCSYIASRYIPNNIDTVGKNSLLGYDSQTEGLEISVTHGGVAICRFTEPRRRNPLTKVILEKMYAFLTQCGNMEINDDDGQGRSQAPVKVLRIESTGPCFSSGHDFKDLGGATREAQKEVLDICSAVNLKLKAIPQISIACVAGAALAGGMQMLSSCDLVMAHKEKATFCLPGTRGRGFCHTPSVSVAERVMSTRKAFELAILSEEIDAIEAEKIGLVNKIFNTDEEFRNGVEDVCNRLTRWFGPNMVNGKKTFYQMIEGGLTEEKYKIATGPMLDMFQSNLQKRTMLEFADGTRKKRKEAQRLAKLANNKSSK